MSPSVFLEKLTVRNFRSIRDETVTFDNPLFLVGRNGSGKSNFADSIAFLSDCMSGALQAVVARHGSANIFYCRHPHTSLPGLQTTLRADFRIDKRRGHYAFSLGFYKGVFPGVLHEQCQVYDKTSSSVWFDRTEMEFRTNIIGLKPVLDPLSLALPVVGGIKDFAPILKALAAMEIYAIDPHRVAEVQDPSTGRFLEKDGSNIASIMKRLENDDHQAFARISELLKPIAPGIASVHVEALGEIFSNKLALVFEQDRDKGAKPLFGAGMMSDGTLRALGIIVAALQNPAPSLIVLEEPEAIIHPGALATIADVIETAARRTQVVVTTHSPDLIDAKWIGPQNLRVVEWNDDSTQISPLGIRPVKALQEHLMGAGELLRANSLDAESHTEGEEQGNKELFDTIPA